MSMLARYFSISMRSCVAAEARRALGELARNGLGVRDHLLDWAALPTCGAAHLPWGPSAAGQGFRQVLSPSPRGVLELAPGGLRIHADRQARQVRSGGAGGRGRW